MAIDPEQLAVTNRLAEATLAAAIVQVRGDATPKAVQEALSDAHHLLNPQRSASIYQAWQKKHDLR